MQHAFDETIEAWRFSRSRHVSRFQTFENTRFVLEILYGNYTGIEFMQFIIKAAKNTEEAILIKLIDQLFIIVDAEKNKLPSRVIKINVEWINRISLFEIGYTKGSSFLKPKPGWYVNQMFNVYEYGLINVVIKLQVFGPDNVSETPTSILRYRVLAKTDESVYTFRLSLYEQMKIKNPELLEYYTVGQMFHDDATIDDESLALGNVLKNPFYCLVVHGQEPML